MLCAESSTRCMSCYKLSGGLPVSNEMQKEHALQLAAKHTQTAHTSFALHASKDVSVHLELQVLRCLRASCASLWLFFRPCSAAAEEGKDLSVCVLEKGAEVGALPPPLASADAASLQPGRVLVRQQHQVQASERFCCKWLCPMSLPPARRTL